MSGGGARPVVPFLKRAGFLASDGTPTQLYKQFRNPNQRGSAAAQGLKNAYGGLYAVNEYVHDANDANLKGLIIQVTGLEEESRLIPAMIGSFKTLRSYADFGKLADGQLDKQGIEEREDSGSEQDQNAATGAVSGGLRLGYTINLNLPATTDIAVFNAIFKSLREHLL